MKIQESKEYNSKTGNWEMMSFNKNKKGNVSASPMRKEKKAATKDIEDVKKKVASKMK